MYSAWIKIDDSLPWIEFEEAFQTKAGAQEAVKGKLCKVKIKIVNVSTKEKQIKVPIAAIHKK
jgi:ribosomal protein L21E